jgi:hypothetical protein
MRTTNFIRLLLVLTLTILATSSNSETTCTENSLGDQTCVTVNTINVPGVSTGNLISQDFLDGSWTDNGTGQLNVMHGSGTVAGINNGEVETTISLNNTLTKEQINTGFSSTLGVNIWFWNGYTQSVTMRQTLVDDNGNTITQSRTIDRNDNYFQTHTDTIIVSQNSKQNYNITGNFSFSVPGTSGHTAADIQNPTLNVTTNGLTTTSTSETFTYCFDREPNTCTYDDKELAELTNLTTDGGQSYNDFIQEKIDTIDVQEFNIVDTSIFIKDELGIENEFDFDEYVENNFNEFLTNNNLIETFETALIEENISEKEFFDTMVNELKEEFSDDLTTETDTEKLTTETETENLEDANADTKTTEETTEVGNETNQESTNTETVSNESSMDKDTQTEGSETETDSTQTVENKENDDVKTGSASIRIDSIEKKVEKVIAKVIAKLNDVDKKLQAVQYITTKGITAGEADVSSYINKRIYNNQNLYDNVPFYKNLNILEQQQIYKEANLTAYTSKDVIAVQQRQLVDIESDISRIQAELYALKQKRGN